jgi:glycosyltransferase involved in cell wall biosynthesis
MLIAESSNASYRVINIEKFTIELSVVIPVYNAEKNISVFLKSLQEVLDSTLIRYEIIVVNDGSQDNTLELLQKEESLNSRVRVFSYTQNKGKGYAVRTGVIESAGELVMFIDGDLDIQPKLIRDYIEEVRKCDLVIASKKHPLSKVKAPLSRKFLSRMFNFVVRLSTGVRIKDTQSGLKVANGTSLRRIFKAMLVKRYAFDVELLTIARALNLSIKELPVEIHLDHRFKIREMVKMLLDVMAISYRYRIKRCYQNRLI